MALTIDVTPKTVEVTIEPDVFHVPVPKVALAFASWEEVELPKAPKFKDEDNPTEKELLAFKTYQKVTWQRIEKQVKELFAEADVERVMARLLDKADGFDVSHLAQIKRGVVETRTKEPFLDK